MKTGGVRKLRIPGTLAFGEKPLPSAPGRMALPPFQPVEATVTLDFIPGAATWRRNGATFFFLMVFIGFFMGGLMGFLMCFGET